MKRVILIVCLSLALGSQAHSQFAGQLSTPRTVPQGDSRASLYAGIYEDALGILGQYRYGMGAYTDIGLKLGVIDFDRGRDSDAGLDLAFDLKYRVMEMRLRDPIELSVGGALELFAVENLNILSFGAFTVGSYPIELKSGRTLEPYGRLILRVARYDYEDFDSDTDLELGFNFGTAIELSRRTRAYGELQFDDPFGFLMGIDFEI